jgi:hypothetical protein
MQLMLPVLLGTLLNTIAGIRADSRLGSTGAVPAVQVVLESLKVNSLLEPISIDDLRPSFSWQVDAINGERGVVTEGFELEVDEQQPGGTAAPVWRSGIVATNNSQFIQWPAACRLSSKHHRADTTDATRTRTRPAVPLTACPQQQLSSDSDYVWRVRAYPGPSAWSVSSFSTSLLQQSDWAPSFWIQSNGTSAAT